MEGYNDMGQIIIHPHENTIAVVRRISPIGSIHSIAKKAVPNGVPYLIIDESELPTDYSKRHLWQADFSTPDGYGDA